MKKISLNLTQKQWFQVIEGLDETGGFLTKMPKTVSGYLKHRAHGRKLLALAESLRNKLKGKL